MDLLSRVLYQPSANVTARSCLPGCHVAPPTAVVPVCSSLLTIHSRPSVTESKLISDKSPGLAPSTPPSLSPLQPYLSPSSPQSPVLSHPQVSTPTVPSAGDAFAPRSLGKLHVARKSGKCPPGEAPLPGILAQSSGPELEGFMWSGEPPLQSGLKAGNVWTGLGR